MRLWSLHPALLDRAGLIAGWREALLAQKVLQGLTRGYRHHPQLDRFRSAEDPVTTIGAYLAPLADEAAARGYRFDRSKIARPGHEQGAVTVTAGQLAFEWDHLGRKVSARAPEWYGALPDGPRPHPLFRVVPGGVEEWERA